MLNYNLNLCRIHGAVRGLPSTVHAILFKYVLELYLSKYYTINISRRGVVGDSATLFDVESASKNNSKYLDRIA